MRAGTLGLSLLSAPLNVQVLQALSDDSKTLPDLRRAVGAPPQTTLRLNLRSLIELGVLERRRLNHFPGSVEFELTPSGRDLLAVADVLEVWLAQAPQGPLALGSLSAKNAVKAMLEGWSTAIVRVLAARPLSLTELSKLIGGLSYPSLERRLTAMRMAGQIETCQGDGRGTPYRVTPWLRRAVGPLAASARWECANVPDEAPPVGKTYIEGAFLLAIPLLRLPDYSSGTCRLSVALARADDSPRLAGVLVDVREGVIGSTVARLEGKVDGWASGSTARWLDAIVEGERGRLEVGGDADLVTEIIEDLHRTLSRQGKSAASGSRAAASLP